MKKSHCLILAAIALCSLIAKAEDPLPKGMLEPCKRRPDNLEKIKTACNSQVPQVCVDQIQTSRDKCLNASAMTDDDKATIEKEMDGDSKLGFKDNVKLARTGYVSGQTKYLKQAELCGDEMGKVKDVCGKSEAELQTSIKTIGDNQLLTEAGQDANARYVATRNARETAYKALEDEGQCSTNQAQIYGNAIAKADGIINRVGSGLDVTAATKDTSADPYVNTVTGKAKGMAVGAGVGVVAEGVTNVSSGSALGSTLAKGIVRAPGAVGLAGAVYEGDVTSVGVKGLQTGFAVFAPTLTGVVAAPLLAIPIVMHSSPAGTCSDRITNPVNAYSANCPIATLSGASANESAIASLSQK